MSVDLDVPLVKPLKIALVAETVEKQLRNLLFIHSGLYLTLSETQLWRDGERQAKHPVWLDAVDDSFTSVIMAVAEVGSIKLMSYLSPWSQLGDEVLTVTISPTRSSVEHGGLILAAACSIAISRLSGTFIRDITAVLNTKEQIAPDFLFELLRCHTEHLEVHSAIREVISNIAKT